MENVLNIKIKFRVIILIFFILLIASYLILCTISFIKAYKEYNISRLSSYYRSLAFGCVKEINPIYYIIGFDCCLSSVEEMAKNNYKAISTIDECPGGLGMAAGCIGSYTFCLPAGQGLKDLQQPIIKKSDDFNGNF